MSSDGVQTGRSGNSMAEDKYHQKNNTDSNTNTAINTTVTNTNNPNNEGSQLDEELPAFRDNSDNSSGSDVSCTEETSSNSFKDKQVLLTSTAQKRRKPREKLHGRKFSPIEDGGCCRDQTYSVYVTSYDNAEKPETMRVRPEKFATVIEGVVKDRFHLQRTACGLIASFYNEDDINRVMKLEMGRIFGQPVQIIRFQKGEVPYKKFVLVKDVPWCIATPELRRALKMQRILAGQITRNRNQVRVEVFNSCDVERLVQEGLNFYNCTSFPAVVETSSNVHYGEQNIVQCFNCQGFWHTAAHCRFETKCVRCGEKHDVENCTRCRSDPVCCHCGGPHHAAYKNCPVRLQHLNSVQVAFTLAKNNKPRRQYHFLR